MKNFQEKADAARKEIECREAAVEEARRAYIEIMRDWARFAETNGKPVRWTDIEVVGDEPR